ncbi:MAG TPA: MgtC/SapB family protein [Candidatus Limnocylindrales bacterium]|nr:MgtC/SapB family protein [Candidatus Limnocylindrales bacterium]
MPVDLAEQLDISLRLLVAAALGAGIGLEREIHAHPAGMRTHLLVSLGSAAFTVISIFVFETPPSPNGTIPTDPSRVAAQIVSGIGFLGAGAILKYGASVRGLTTAASLWATAAVGMAAGGAAYVVAVVTTLIIVFSLGPLNALVARLRLQNANVFRVRIMAGRLEALGEISRSLTANKVEIAGVNSERHGKGRYELELDLRLPAGTEQQAVVSLISAVSDVDIIEAGAPTE